MNKTIGHDEPFSVRQCLASLAEQALRQAETDPNLHRRRQLRRLAASLTFQLARTILRESHDRRPS